MEVCHRKRWPKPAPAATVVVEAHASAARHWRIYPELDFDVPIGTGEVGVLGDCYARYLVRIKELNESSKMVRQCLEMIPDGPVLAKVPKKLKPPEGDVHVRVEASRGDMGWYLVSDGSEFPYRTKIRTGSFSAMGIVEKLSRGLMLADLIALIASLDVVAPEVDR